MRSSNFAEITNSKRHGIRISEVIFIAYVALVIYGSLFPFHPWLYPKSGLSRGLTHFPAYISRSDLLANVLVYFPVGLLFVWTRQGMRSALFLIASAICIGTALSLMMESLQAFLPRDSSVVDLLANIVGTAAGGVVGIAIQLSTKPAAGFFRWKRNNFKQGVATDLGLIAMCVWVATQAFPFVPSLDVSSVRQSISPAWQAIVHHSRVDVLGYVAYTSAVASLVMLAAQVGTHRLRSLRSTAIILGATFALKPLIVSRTLSVEALAGYVTGVGVAYLFVRTRAISPAAGFFILANVIVLELTPDHGPTHPFNWIPFYGAGVNPLTGFLAMIELMWQPLAFCSLLLSTKSFEENRITMWQGATFAGSVGLMLESIQRWIPGRYPEITPALLWAGTWLLCWGWAISRKHQHRKD